VHFQALVLQRLALHLLLQSRRPSPRNQGHQSLTREVHYHALVLQGLPQEVLPQEVLHQRNAEVLDLASRACVFE